MTADRKLLHLCLAVSFPVIWLVISIYISSLVDLRPPHRFDLGMPIDRDMVANLRTRDAADENANDYYYMCENAANDEY